MTRTATRHPRLWLLHGLLALDLLISIIVAPWIAIILWDFTRQPLVVEGTVVSKPVAARRGRPIHYLVLAANGESRQISVTDRAAATVDIGERARIAMTPLTHDWLSVENMRTGARDAAARDPYFWLINLAAALVPLFRRRHWSRFDWGWVVTIAAMMKWIMFSLLLTR